MIMISGSQAQNRFKLMDKLFKSEPINIPKAGSISKILKVMPQSFTSGWGEKFG